MHLLCKHRVCLQSMPACFFFYENLFSPRRTDISMGDLRILKILKTDKTALNSLKGLKEEYQFLQARGVYSFTALISR